MNTRVLVSSLFVLAGCAGPTLTLDSGTDLPIALDDAGVLDGGTFESDAGAIDAGEDLDAGTTVDAGQPTPDAGPCGAVPVRPVCTAGGWCWKNPLPLATQLNDVWANGCSAWAAGVGGMLLERTSEGWAPRTSGTSETLNGFAAFAPDDAWLVGENGTLLHFDGRRWSVERSNTSSASYRAAYAPERGLVFIAGSDGLHRYQGGVLTTILAPLRTSFTGITGRDASTLRAVGEEYVPNVARNAVSWSFDGRTWASNNAGSMVRWNRVAHDGLDFYAAGKMNAHGPDWGFIGKLPWQLPLATHAASSEFLDLAARGPREFLTVGRSWGTATGMLRFDGSAYRSVIDAPNASFTAVDSSGGDFFVVGDQLGRVSEGAWKPESSGRRDTFSGVLPLANGDVWLSGGLRSRQGGPFVETGLPATPPRLTDLSGESPTDLWAIGDSNAVWHFDGTSWAPAPNGPTTRVTRLRATETGEVWAWSSASLWLFQAGVWTQLTLPGLNFDVTDVAPEPFGLVYVTGRFGNTYALFRGNGSRFSGQPLPASAASGLRLLRTPGGLELWAVTNQGEVIRRDANSGVWTTIALPVANTWVTDLVVSGSRVVVVGPAGLVLRWDGARFVEEDLGARVGFASAAIESNGTLWVVGSDGAVVSRP